MAQIELESYKYMKNVMLEEKGKWRQARDRKALQDFATFVFGLAAMFIGTFAVQEHQRWMPVVSGFLGL